MISVCIITWNSELFIGQCLQSLLNELHQERFGYEIFCIDNGSSDQTLAILNEFKINPDVRIVSLPHNRGTTYSRNLALKQARGDYILVLDADTRVQRGLLGTLIAVLQKNQKIGIVAPKLLYPDGECQISYKKFPTVPLKLFKAAPIKQLRELGTKMESYHFPLNNSQLYVVDYCPSACWLIPARIIQKVGLLDERIFYSPEDVDYCLRVWLSAHHVVYCPQAQVIHDTQRLSYKNKSIALSHLHGLGYFFRKYGYVFSRKSIYRKIELACAMPYPVHE